MHYSTLYTSVHYHQCSCDSYMICSPPSPSLPTYTGSDCVLVLWTVPRRGKKLFWMCMACMRVNDTLLPQGISTVIVQLQFMVHIYACVCVCVCVCMRAFACVCVRACVCACTVCVHVCVRACVHACIDCCMMHFIITYLQNMFTSIVVG